MTIDPELGREIVARLSSAPHANRGTVQEEYCALLGWSHAKFWRVAKQFGYRSNRKPRADKGVPKKVDPETIRKAAAVIERTRRKTGKVNMPTWNLQLHFEDNHIIEPEEMPHEATINRHMREMGISRAALSRPEAATTLRSDHPNHVHLIDASVCVLWDFKENKKLATRDMQMEFYKNKPGFWRKVKKVILRYICVDHCTGWFFVWYYYSQGEDFNNIFDFTMRAWGEKSRLEGYNSRIFPAHGVPRILMIDKGAANTSQAYTNLMENLQTEVYVHTPGKPWISGAVERMHGYWESVFEGDLSLLTVEDLDFLNRRAYDKCAYINAVRKHKRHAMSRFEAYSRITSDQLRILPPVDVCKKLAHRNAEVVTVDGYKQIRYEGNIYLLKGYFRRGDKLYVRYNPYEYPALEINTQTDENGRFCGESVASTLVNRDQWGFPEKAATIGKDFKTHAWDSTKRFKEDLKGIDTSDVVPREQAHKIEKMTWLPKEGTDVIPEKEIVVPPMTAHEARKRLREELGIRRFTVVQSQWVDQRMTDTVTEESYLRIREEYRGRFAGRDLPGEARGLKMAANNQS